MYIGNPFFDQNDNLTLTNSSLFLGFVRFLTYETKRRHSYLESAAFALIAWTGRVLVPDKEKHGSCNLERKIFATKRVALQPAENSRRTTGRSVSDAKNKATGKHMCIIYLLYIPLYHVNT